MTTRMMELATIAAVLGTGAMGGVFFVFSNFVMQGLARLPAAQGVAAMQAINVTAINRWFMAALFGTGLLCVALFVLSLARSGDSGARIRIVGSAAYVLGTIVVTMACNVPRNDALAALSPDGVDTATVWASYLREWTAWNHVRTASSLLASIALVVGLLAAQSNE